MLVRLDWCNNDVADTRYTDNPRTNPDATPVRVVRDIRKVRQQGINLFVTGKTGPDSSLYVNTRNLFRHRRDVYKTHRC